MSGLILEFKLMDIFSQGLISYQLIQGYGEGYDNEETLHDTSGPVSSYLMMC